MTLQSMTGFARSEGTAGSVRWVWEIRSVNGKGLDTRLRLPNGCERLEPAVRSAAAARFARGNMQLSLGLGGLQSAGVPVINEEALAVVLKLVDTLKSRIEAAPPTLDGLLNIRGIVELREPEETDEQRAAFDTAVLEGLQQALDGLAEMRAAEGEALKTVLEGHLATIETITQTIDQDPSRQPETIRERLATQVALLTDNPTLDMDRLHMEAVLLAAKADLREELDRLHAHVAQGRALLAKGGAVGRRLDFLAQEFNRETNTICSKSNAASVTAKGMELKVIVDQFREQVQNLE
ncbi:YicC/YloC family endoribonuclease [Pararhizobium haloflavum]|uniref:YicC/YloC family endoribonuclease n=1 Tax=Pararhizobium haloflavum TaxID=2037914 RepID=UPI000C184DAE|nr:YicC/YloC family endoribonuclease [Pararhizobium haloflavum]